MQWPSLDLTNIEGVEWADERFTDFLNADQETVSSATEIFNITVTGVFSALRGPGTVYPDPLPEPAVPPGQTYDDVPVVADPDDPGGPYNPITIIQP